MNPLQSGIENISEEERRSLEQLRTDFERSWEEGCLPERLRTLPLTGPLRPLALWEMVKIDLCRHWQQGRKEPIESYLQTFPELGSADTVPLDVIQAELSARQQAGESVSWADYARRFPRQTGHLRQWLDRALQGQDNPGTLDPSHLTETGSSADAPFMSTLRAPDNKRAQTDPGLASAAAASCGQLDRYKLLRVLGRGQMGTVYLAEDTELPRQVALKAPHFRADDDPDAVARFRREVQAVARLDHPNLCRIYDFGVVDGTPYFTMPYIQGESLAQYLRKHQKLPQRQAAELVQKMALALQEAHSSGVVHRDLKPSNIMMNQRGEPIVMDFGLARPLDVQDKLTLDGAVMGTAAYMPPEQATGDHKAIGPASDIYSLGVVLYELLTGRVPFQGTLHQVLVQTVSEQPPPPSQFLLDLDPRLEQICLKAMAAKVANRYASMAEFAAALGGYLAGADPGRSRELNGTEREVLRVERDLPSGTEREVPRAERDLPRKPRRRRALALALVVLMALVGAALGLLFRPSDSSAPVIPTRQGEVVLPKEQRPVTVAPPAVQTISVALRTVPDGAHVSIDGQAQARPTNGKFELEAGWHQLHLTREGYEPLKVKLEVKPGAGPYVQEYPLTPLPRAVTVVTNPRGAEVSIPGQPAKKSPADYRLPPGRYTVKVALLGYETVSQDLVVSAGQGPQEVAMPLTLLPGEKYALLVGVHAPGKGLPDFVHAEPDVVELGRVLVVAGYGPQRVRVLTQTAEESDPQRRPTAANVRKELKRLAQTCTPADSVLVALVGHHARFEADALGSFCPAEADLKDKDTLVALADVYEALGKCKAGTRLLLLDGWRQHWQQLAPSAVEPSRGADFQDPSNAPPAGVSVFWSCSAGEKSYEHPDLRHGVFCHGLIRGLQGTADADGDRRVTLDELVVYVKGQTAKLTQQKQTPQWAGPAGASAEPLVRLEGALIPFNKGAVHLEKAQLEKGERATKEYQDAVAAFGQAEAAAPDYVEIYTSRAFGHFNTDNSGLALADCVKALQLDPDCATALDYLAELQVRKGDFTNGLANLRKAIALDRHYGRVHFQYGWALARSEAHKEAVAAFSEALACDPNMKEAYYNRGVSYYRLKDYKAAIEDQGQAIHLDGNFAEAWQNRGLVHAALRQYDDAIRDFQQVLQLRPGYAPAQGYLTRALELKKKSGSQ